MVNDFLRWTVLLEEVGFWVILCNRFFFSDRDGPHPAGLCAAWTVCDRRGYRLSEKAVRCTIVVFCLSDRLLPSLTAGHHPWPGRCRVASVIGPSGRLFRSQKTATHRLLQSLSIKKKKKERKKKAAFVVLLYPVFFHFQIILNLIRLHLGEIKLFIA